MTALLEIRNLHVEFGALAAVQGLDLSVDRGELLGIAGESGSGKSVSMLALMGLVDTPGRVSADVLRFDGHDLLALSPRQRRTIVGRDMAMIFQDPVASLNPAYTVGFQIMETLQAHRPGRRAALRERALELLKLVEIPDAESRLAAYPHQLSGGMSQRVMIAMALACAPKLLIADEPTTALDVTIQAQVLDLLVSLQQQHDMALILISHELALLAEHAKRIAVMRAGEVVEMQAMPALFERPQHAYTKALLNAVPGNNRHAPLPAEPAVTAEPLLEARDLSRHYAVSQGAFKPATSLKALDGVSFTLSAGQTLAVVGESGCGKSTLARLLAMVELPTGGRLVLEGQDAAAATPAQLRELRPRVQMVFQNPYASLNPRKHVVDMLDEPLKLNTQLSTTERRERIADMLAQVGLRPEHAQRFPHMFSGGQRQRIAIARAMMLNPGLLVADEPTSALDVSIQAQILQLFMDLQQRTQTAYVFISHNLSVVEHIAGRVMVMYLGKVVELAPKAALFAKPLHPYTKALLSATPSLDPARRAARVRLPGELPSPLNPPAGCSFHTRCPHAQARCKEEVPQLRAVGPQEVACHFAESLA
ncbi:MAG: ABC transporter ATP-binding protein [Rhizobacter sp.]